MMDSIYLQQLVDMMWEDPYNLDLFFEYSRIKKLIQLFNNSPMTKIEWCDEVWNPVTGCTRVSAGCDNCYAARMTKRLEGMGQEKYTGLINPGKKHFNGLVKFHPEELRKPMKWKKPRVIFVNSMSDVFHEGINFHGIDEIFAAMATAPQHQFIVLTKRPERALRYFQWMDPSWKNEGMRGPERIRYCAYHNFGSKIEYEDFKWPLPNVWIGVSVEDQQAAEARIPLLLKIPAAHRLISCEPLLGPIHFDATNKIWKLKEEHRAEYGGKKYIADCWGSLVDWVIAGGESGPNARPVHPDWIRSIRDQCAGGGIPFFFKQWGEYVPLEFDAQPPYRFFSMHPDRLIDGHGIQVEDPQTWEGGRFAGGKFMTPMDAITLCMETQSAQCDFLRVGKGNASVKIDGKQHLDNPARKRAAAKRSF